MVCIAFVLLLYALFVVLFVCFVVVALITVVCLWDSVRLFGRCLWFAVLVVTLLY